MIFAIYGRKITSQGANQSFFTKYGVKRLRHLREGESDLHISRIPGYCLFSQLYCIITPFSIFFLRSYSSLQTDTCYIHPELLKVVIPQTFKPTDATTSLYPTFRDILTSTVSIVLVRFLLPVTLSLNERKQRLD